MCQALRAEIYLHIVFPDNSPALEAVKAERTNSLAGKHSSGGIFSCLQKSRKRESAREYPAIVAADRLFRMDLSSRVRVLVDSKGLAGRIRVDGGRLKKKSLRARVLEGKGLSLIVGAFGCFITMLLRVVIGSLHTQEESEVGVLRTAAEVYVRERIKLSLKIENFGDKLGGRV